MSAASARCEAAPSMPTTTPPGWLGACACRPRGKSCQLGARPPVAVPRLLLDCAHIRGVAQLGERSSSPPIDPSHPHVRAKARSGMGISAAGVEVMRQVPEIQVVIKQCVVALHNEKTLGLVRLRRQPQAVARLQGRGQGGPRRITRQQVFCGCWRSTKSPMTHWSRTMRPWAACAGPIPCSTAKAHRRQQNSFSTRKA